MGRISFPLNPISRYARTIFLDAIKLGEAICPSCNKPNKAIDLEHGYTATSSTAAQNGMSVVERKLSMIKSTKSMLIMRSKCMILITMGETNET